MAKLTETRRKTTQHTLTGAENTVGERLRRLRRDAGLTQTELAGGRFSKEYVSQIERGRTTPNAETLEWVAARLGVDAALLEHGVSTDDRGRIEATLARGEALLEAEGESLLEPEEAREAATLFSGVRRQLDKVPLKPIEFRALLGETSARIRLGEVREALDLLARARELSEEPDFTDVDRAEVLYRMGVCRYELSSIQTAVSLFSEALALAESAGLPCDRLRASILRYRSRCYRRQRDWEAAREDVERALELAESMGDPRAIASAYFQASLVAERGGHWVLARTYAERAKAEYEQLADRAVVGRLLNNLGGLNFLLGKPEEATRYLKDSFSVALDVGNDIDAGYAISSLAQVHLKTGKPDMAEEQSRKALDLLGDRVDYLDEIGNAQLVLGRSLLEQGRLDEADEVLRSAEQSFEQIESPGHRSAGLLARGDLALRRGDEVEAARLYKAAAELLQDVRF